MCAAAALGVVDEIQVSPLTLMPLTLMPLLLMVYAGAYAVGCKSERC